MSANGLQQKLRQLFILESQETMQFISQTCLLLEKQPDPAAQSDLLADILRQTHNLKGSARALGWQEIADLLHGLETLFAAIKTSGGPPETAVYDLVYATLDTIGRLIADAAPQETPLAALLTQLATAVAHIQPPTAVAPAPIQPAPLPETPSPASQETIRVTVNRLDAIFNLVNELQIAHLSLEGDLGQMRRLLDQAGLAASPAREQFADLYRHSAANHRHLSQLLAQLQDDVRQARMLPLATVLNALPRSARQLAQELGKTVALQIEGGDVEVDRAVLEQIRSPLLHLLHNSLDHGLETPENRRASGKPETGQISITAVRRGSGVLIKLSDDGVGLDLARIVAQAAQRGLVTPEAAQQLTEQEIIWLLFQPGFSLADGVSATSGRGIGLDIVRRAVGRLHGVITVDNRPGAGVCFSLSLPVSIATSLCLLVRLGGQIFALPTRHIIHLRRVDPEDVVGDNGRLRLTRPGAEAIPAVNLARLLLMQDSGGADECQTAVLVGSPDQPAALLVGEICSVQEMVIKKLPAPVAHMPFISGASISGTGAVILVFNLTDVIGAIK